MSLPQDSPLHSSRCPPDMESLLCCHVHFFPLTASKSVFGGWKCWTLSLEFFSSWAWRGIFMRSTLIPWTTVLHNNGNNTYFSFFVSKGTPKIGIGIEGFQIFNFCFSNFSMSKSHSLMVVEAAPFHDIVTAGVRLIRTCVCVTRLLSTKWQHLSLFYEREELNSVASWAADYYYKFTF